MPSIPRPRSYEPNKCIASGNKCLTSNKKLLETLPRPCFGKRSRAPGGQTTFYEGRGAGRNRSVSRIHHPVRVVVSDPPTNYRYFPRAKLWCFLGVSFSLGFDHVRFARQVAVQMNDTHPTIAVPWLLDTGATNGAGGGKT